VREKRSKPEGVNNEVDKRRRQRSEPEGVNNEVDKRSE